ncbi:MAG: FtsX-like permease family protein [Acidobacteriaceae bacterium]
MGIPLADQQYPTPDAHIRFFRELLNEIRSLPGVKTATVDDSFPFAGRRAVHVQIGSRPVDNRITLIHLTDPEYLSIAGRRMIQGHFLDAREIADQSHEIVVTENFVKRYFNGENVLGRTVRLPEFMPDGKTKLKNDAFIVVGVMNNIPMFATLPQDYPQIFIPYTVAPIGDTLIVSTALPADGLMNSVRQTIYSIDRNQPIVDAMSVRQMLDMYGYAGARFSLALFGAFAVAALLLSLIGIYGVLSFITSQRRREIGIRMALGANRAQVMWMVLRQACVLALLGVAVGLPLAFIAGRLAKGELIRTSQYDPPVLIAAIFILPLLAAAGTYLPARRAANIDPVTSLRTE